MQKIMIIGGNGSGKSTVAHQLSEQLNLPCFHLDKLFWSDSGELQDRDQAMNEVRKIELTESWIIDGNYSETWPTRMKEADCILFLDITSDIRISRLEQRSGDHLKNGSMKETSVELINYAKRYDAFGRVKVLKLINDESVAKKTIHVTSELSNNEILAYFSKV